jgi:hypothetical protein
MRRLGRISFLGTLDDHPRCRHRSTRLEHSLGVADLAVQVGTSLALKSDLLRELVAAALVHDAGHYPLSHAAEHGFERVTGANHHEVTQWLVTGRGALSVPRSLRPTLEALGIDPEAVWSLVDGSASREDRVSLEPLLRGVINLDTLEGIHRAARDFRLPRGPAMGEVFCWVEDELGIARDAIPAVDEFWALKNRVYEHVINQPANILAEGRLCDLVSRRFEPGLLNALEDFDDSKLWKTLGSEGRDAALRPTQDDGWALLPRAAEGAPLVRIRKRYHVDATVEPTSIGLPASRWSARYRHARERAALVPKDAQLEFSFEPSMVLETPEVE